MSRPHVPIAMDVGSMTWLWSAYRLPEHNPRCRVYLDNVELPYTLWFNEQTGEVEYHPNINSDDPPVVVGTGIVRVTFPSDTIRLLAEMHYACPQPTPEQRYWESAKRDTDLEFSYQGIRI